MSDKEGNKGLTNNQLEKRLLKMEGELKVAKLQKENADMRAKLEKKNAEAELAEVKAKAAKMEFGLKATIQFIEMKKDKEKLEKDNEGMQKQINELKAAAGKANDGDRGVQPLLGIGNKNNNDNTNLFVAGAEDTGQVQPKEEPENNLEILEVILVPTRKVVSKVNEGDQQRQPQDKPTSSTAVTLGKKATQQPAGKLGDGLALGGGQKAKELSMVKARGQQNKLQGGGHNQQQTKDRKRHTCKECSKSFSTLSNLKQHYRTHTGEKPYKCKVCDRRFVSSSSLKVHMRIHTGVKPYECGECDRRFYLQQHLMRHIQTHTGEKPFECKSCGKRFTRADNMKQHQKKNACKPVTTDEHQGFVKQEEMDDSDSECAKTKGTAPRAEKELAYFISFMRN